MVEQVTIDVESRADRWRFTCPEGHNSWQPVNGHFYCVVCAERDYLDGDFELLWDHKHDEMVSRDGVELINRFQPFDADRDYRKA